MREFWLIGHQVVQFGRKVKINIMKTEGKGWGECGHVMPHIELISNAGRCFRW